MSDWNAETAEWYAEKYGEYATNRLAVEQLVLLPDCSVLDIGCGTGSALRHVAKLGNKGTLVGVDIVPRMVEIAEERRGRSAAANRLYFRTGAAEALPVGDAEFDVVLAFDSYDHWNDPAAGLAEVRRVMRPGGLFCVVKDGGVQSLRTFREQATANGFTVQSEEHIEGDGVTFTLWQCRLANRTNTPNTDEKSHE